MQEPEHSINTDLLKNPAKRKLQNRVLSRIIINLKRYRNKLTVLCMPGVTGWDIEYFISFPEISRIICIEEDEAIFKSLIARYGKSSRIEIINSKTTEFLYLTKYKFDIIYLDYFSNFSSVVKIDFKLIFKRKLLNIQGKLVFQLYGARETCNDFYDNLDLYTSYCERFGERAIYSTGEGLRCAAVHAYLVELQRKYKFKFECPSWFKYKSGNAFMYLSWVPYNGDTLTRKGGTGAVRATPEKWFLRGKYFPIKEETQAFYSVPKRLGKTHHLGKREYYKTLIKKYYEENHKTPTVVELNEKFKTPLCINDWRKLIQEAGLCPNQKSTEEELKKEINRIYKRHGFITYSLLMKAKIARRPEIHRIVKDLGIPLANGTTYQLRKYVRMARIVEDFTAYLESGGIKTKYKHYSFIRNRKLLNRESCLVFLRKFEERKRRGEFDRRTIKPFLTRPINELVLQ